MSEILLKQVGKHWSKQMILTREQKIALKAVYDRDTTVAPSYLAFRRTAFLAFGDCVMVPWCGMILGIETDGYTHS
mgnify:CR=1 FL=1